MKELEPEEKEILESYEKDEWRTISDLKTETARYRGHASATFKKDKRVNIRISEKDLTAIQKIAAEEGIPYQTLIASVLHKFISGRLTEKEA